MNSRFYCPRGDYFSYNKPSCKIKMKPSYNFNLGHQYGFQSQYLQYSLQLNNLLKTFRNRKLQLMKADVW